MHKEPSKRYCRKILYSACLALGCGTLLYIGISTKTSWLKSPIIAEFSNKPIDQATAKKHHNFDVVLVSKWTAGNCPCLPMQIDEKIISAVLDLGFRGYFSINSTLLEQIEDKTLLGSRVMYGYQGTPFQENVFHIPKIQIGGRIFNSPSVQEERIEFEMQSAITKDGNNPAIPEAARIGWKIFQNTQVLLDLRNKKIAFCDNFHTLKEHGYPIEKFVQTPLFIDRGLVEINAEIEGKPLRCILDTGSTFSVLNTENIQNKTLQELLWNAENFYVAKNFKINDLTFNSMTFRQIPIQIPILIDAILGIDFLSNNIIFLDFINNIVYFGSYD